MMGERVVLERRFPQQPGEVFEAWTSIEVLSRWFGCGVDMLWDIHEWDVRAGGTLRVSLDYDGTPFVVEGEFLAVDPPHHLRYRWSNETVDVTFTADAYGCLVTLRHEGVPTDELCEILSTGWTGSLARLQETLSSPAIEEAR